MRAKVHDVGVPDDWVKWFRDAVQPGTFTVVLLVGQDNRLCPTAAITVEGRPRLGQVT